MISVKYFSKWFKEAGRGHAAAVFSWGAFLVYTVFTLLELSVSAKECYAGIGNDSLLKLCIVLGITVAAAEYWYLHQPAKLDFYYSLPVKKGTVFWSRYLHGIVHVFLPLTVSLAVLSVYGGAKDPEFLLCAGSYAVRSAAVFFAVFLMFYHMTICAFLAGGRLASVFLLDLLAGTTGLVVVRVIGTVYAEHFFAAYYRIPAFERLEELLAPGTLAETLAGMNVYERQEVLEYVPEGRIILAAAFWILLSGLLSAYLQKKRKPENVGKVFAFPGAYRVVSFLAAVLIPLSFVSLLLEVTEIPAQGSAGAAVLTAVCLVVGILVHLLAERLDLRGRKRYDYEQSIEEPTARVPLLRRRSGMQQTEEAFGKYSGLFRRKWQMFAEGMFVCLVVGGFLAGADSFDHEIPEQEELRAIRICVNGLNMSYKESAENEAEGDSYGTDRGLSQYRFTEEGLTEGLKWAGMLAEKQEEKGSMKEAQYTFAVVCYEGKDGTEKYRAYPTDEEEFQAFSSVFDTEEYKRMAYPALTWTDVGDNRFTWRDGVCGQVLPLSKKEKEEVFQIWKEEMGGLKMDDLKTAAPEGILEMRSERWGETQRLLIYPFFEDTVSFLKSHGTETGKDLLDYPVRSLDVRSVRPAGENRVGGAVMKHYETEGELTGWKDRLVWEELDWQPLLYPLRYEEEIEIEAEDPASGALTEVRCYQK